jgi:hypothetical protein
MTEKVYGYTYLGCAFKQILRLRDDEVVVHETKRVPWADVVGFRAFPDFYPDLILAFLGSAKPRLALYLRTGEVLHVRGDLLVKAFDEMHREKGIPIAFEELVDDIRTRGVMKWNGPKEETVLFTTGWALFVVGLIVGMAIALQYGVSTMPIGIGVAVGVLFAQAAFVVGPLVARRLRTIYLASAKT